MNILDQIHEEVRLMSREVSVLRSELGKLKEQFNDRDKEGIVMRFGENDVMSFTIAAKYLKLKQNQMEEIIQKGYINTTGIRKRNILAKEVFRFSNSVMYKRIKQVGNLEQVI